MVEKQIQVYLYPAETAKYQRVGTFEMGGVVAVVSLLRSVLSYHPPYDRHYLPMENRSLVHLETGRVRLPRRLRNQPFLHP